MTRLEKILLGATTVLIGYVVLSSTTLALFYCRPLITPSDPQKSDAIILFSSGVLGDDWLSTDAAQRTWGALKLYRDGYAPTIVSSGSAVKHKNYHAELQAKWLERAGVPIAAIIIENRSTRTYESVQEVLRIIHARQWSSVVCAVSQLDVPRIRRVFRKLDPAVRVSFLAAPEFDVEHDGPLFVPNGMVAVYHATYEYAALGLYSWKGWI